ncbi:MAPEG family protein [Jannaschia marina]|uniref:MAPEG family protein n=1 Tax=Jannaschia marina TaxID=2741674 RepID=UPI0015C907F7|nr:MAPEG family protein [Jannaschia marina]
MTEALAPYAHALAALGGWAIVMLVLIPVSVAGKPRGRTESGHPVRDYSDPAYRRSRAFRNAIEITGPFVAATLAAILVGASPFWVNLLASLFLVSRIAMAAVHIGTENQTARSACWFVGLLCCLGLALLAVFGAFAL